MVAASKSLYGRPVIAMSSSVKGEEDLQRRLTAVQYSSDSMCFRNTTTLDPAEEKFCACQGIRSTGSLTAVLAAQASNPNTQVVALAAFSSHCSLLTADATLTW